MTTLNQVRIRLSAGGWVNSLSLPNVQALAADPTVEVQSRSFLSDWKPYKPNQPHKPRMIYRARVRLNPPKENP